MEQRRKRLLWGKQPLRHWHHVELWAGMPIHDDGWEEAALGQPAKSRQDWSALYAYPTSVEPDELFPFLAAQQNWDSCYILGGDGDAVTQWDIRGH